MSANLISNKTLSNSVIPFKNGPEVINVFTTSSDFVVPNWYYSLSAILVSGGAAGGPGGGGGAGAVACIKFHARPGDILTGVIGAGGGGSIGDSFSAYGEQGGTTSLSRNGLLILSISGGSGGDWVAAGYGTTTNFMPPASHGSAGGAARLAGLARALQYFSVGAGETVDFFCNFNNSAVSVSGTLLSAAYLAATLPLSSTTKGLGSPGGRAGNNSTDNGYGGGGGFGISATPVFAPSGTGGTGGHAGILIFPVASGGVQKFVLAGGGGGCGDGDYPGGEGNSATYPGGSGGFVTYEGTTYVIGGSGGTTTYVTDSQDPPETTISFTPGGNGTINTGSGGGGSGNSFGSGGSGIIILLGQRSYPFSGKPF